MATTALDRAALPRDALLSQWTQHAACADAELDACATELRQARHVQRAWAAGGVVGDAAQRAEHAAQRAEAAECLSAALWSVLEERAKLLGDDDMVDAATSNALDKAHKRATRAWRVLSSLRGLSRAARDVRREVDGDAVPWLNARYKARKRAASVDKGEPLLAFLLQRGGIASDDAHPVADAAWWATLAQDGDSNSSNEVEDASIPTASDDATLDHRLAAACVVSGDVALRRAVLDGSDGVEAVRKGALALQETAAAVFLPPGIVDVAAVCWGLDVADGLASEASDEEGLSAARAAFARAAPLAADLGSRYGDSSAGLRLLLARRIGRLADLDVAAALFALAALADGDDSRFAVARSVAHSNARRPDRALQVLRAADDRADDASLHTARMRVFEALWARGDRKACAQLPVTFRDEKALAEALAPKARGGDRAAGDCLVAALLRRRRVADAQRLRPFASPRALKALDVAKASHASAEPLEGRYCPYLAALEQGASTKMADEDPARVDVWPAAPDNDEGEDQVMRERPQQRREDQGGGEDDEASHEGPAHVVAAPFTLPAPPTQPRFSFSLPPAPPSSHSIFDGITGGEEKSNTGEVNVASPVDEGRADARAALEARIRDRVDALRQQEDVAMEEAAPAPAPEPMEEEEAAAAPAAPAPAAPAPEPAPPAPEPMEEEEEEAAAAPEPMETELSDDPIEDSEEDVVAAPAEDNTSLGDDDEHVAPPPPADDDDDDDDSDHDDGNDAPAPVAAAAPAPAPAATAPAEDLHAWPNNAADSQTQSQGESPPAPAPQEDSQETVLELYVGGLALDAATGNVCRIVAKKKGWWTVQFLGEDATHSRRAKQLTPRAEDAAEDAEEAPPEAEVLQAMLDEDDEDDAPAPAPAPRRRGRSGGSPAASPAASPRSYRGPRPAPNSSTGSPSRRSSRSRSRGSPVPRRSPRGRAAAAPAPAPAAAPRRSSRGRSTAPAPAPAAAAPTRRSPRRSSRGRSGGSASPAPAPAAPSTRRSSRGRAPATPAAASSSSPPRRRSPRGRAPAPAPEAASSPSPAPAPAPRRSSRGRSGGRSASPAADAPAPAPAPARRGRPRRTAAPAPAPAKPARRSTRGRRGDVDENEDSNPAPSPKPARRSAKPAAAAPLRRSSRLRK